MSVISNSKLKVFNRCQKEYYYKYILNLQSKRKKETLERGTLVHACLEEYYKNGMDKNTISGPIKEYKRKLKKMFDEEAALYNHIPGEVSQILRRYHNYWKDYNRFEIFKFEGEPVIERAFIVPICADVEVGFTLDMAIEDNMGLWVWDNKTAKVIPSDDFRLTDTQSTIYEWGLREVTGKKVKGIVWNYLRTKLPTVPEVLKAGTLTRRSNIDTDKYTYTKAVLALGQDPEDYRDFIDTLPNSKTFYNRIKCPRNSNMIKSILRDVMTTGKHVNHLAEIDRPDKYVRSISFLCDRMCEFRSLCVAELTGLDTDFIIRTQYEPRKEDKYDHKKEEES